MNTANSINDEGFSEAVNKQVAVYAKLFEAELNVTQEMPERFHFPEPSNEVEREAMRLLIDQIELKTGARIQVVHSI